MKLSVSAGDRNMTTTDLDLLNETPVSMIIEIHLIGYHVCTGRRISISDLLYMRALDSPI